MNCKECKCHNFVESQGLGFDGDYRGRGHWCLARIEVEYPTNGAHALYTIREPMSYKESIKTPEWCPKILKTFPAEGLECPIIEVY